MEDVHGSLSTDEVEGEVVGEVLHATPVGQTFMGIPAPHIVTAGQVLAAVTALASHLDVKLIPSRKPNGDMEWTVRLR